ncbi:Peroxidase [Durusdinium trenchii]|uniref:Peroxidase n=1 Tax=Durusdinium trenchii TaxID=1381693 RepID=A0ABP0JCR1_9DINO
MVGLTAEQIREARTGRAADTKSDAILRLTTQVVEKRGFVSDADLTAARSAGVTDAEVTEIVANTALNLLTNYFNHVAETEIDFPLAEELQPEAACETGCSV